MKPPFYFLILLSFLVGAKSHAQETDFSVKRSWKLHLGASIDNFQQRLSAPKGFASKVSQIQGLVGASRSFKLSKRLSFSPEAFILLPWRKGSDGTTFTFTSHLGFLIGYKLSKRWTLDIGNGLLWEMYCSKGQDIILNNGTGTSTFYTPSRWTQVVLPTASIAFEWQIKNGGAAIQLGALVSEFLNSEKRSIRGLGRLIINL